MLHAESGSGWAPVLWGPAFAAVGLLVEVLSPGPVHLVAWAFVAAVLAVAAAVWVHGRRRVCSLRLTPTELVQGRERLELARVRAVTEVGAPVGARVLGGTLTAPRGTHEVPLRLEDDRVVLAWARDPEALRAALARLVE
ncbi:hypothetical protein GCM10027174_37030 [Salinifilum aidingensis]